MFCVLLALLAVPRVALSTSEKDYRDIYQQALSLFAKASFRAARTPATAWRLSAGTLCCIPPNQQQHPANEPAQIDTFRARYAELPVTKLLYSRWLKDQGKRRNWQTLVQRRYDTSNAELACYFVRAQYGSGEKNLALDATTALWSQPKSQPKACDPLFSVWRGTERFSQDVIWQRFSGAMAANERVLARYLQRYLTGSRRSTAKAFYELRSQPQRVTWRGSL